MLRIATALALLALMTPALAQDKDKTGGRVDDNVADRNADTPRLKSSTTVMRETVRIGDLIDNAGDLANIPVFRSPDLGTTGTVSAADVLEAIRGHDLLVVDTAGVDEIEVTRAAREIVRSEIEQGITKAFARQYGFGDGKMSITFDREPRTVLVEPTTTAPLQVVRSSYDPRSSRFDVTFSIPGSTAAKQQVIRYAGKVVEMMDAPILVRPLNRGEIIRAADVIVEPRPKSEVTAETITSLDQIIGYTARLVLRANQPLRRADVVKPDMVKRDEFVTIMYEMPGMLLTVRGKALESGAEGDVISLQNVQSKRNVQGVITGPGRVTLTGAPTTAADVTSSIASTDNAIDPTENLARQGQQ